MATEKPESSSQNPVEERQGKSPSRPLLATGYWLLTSPSPRSPRRAGRIIWATLVFLAGFAVLLVLVSYFYLIPAMEAAQTADPVGRRQLGATARLMLAVVLFILLACLLMSFRIGRFFLPRRRGPSKPTPYVDAWAESARRMKSPPADGE